MHRELENADENLGLVLGQEKVAVGSIAVRWKDACEPASILPIWIKPDSQLPPKFGGTLGPVGQFKRHSCRGAQSLGFLLNIMFLKGLHPTFSISP